MAHVKLRSGRISGIAALGALTGVIAAAPGIVTALLSEHHDQRRLPGRRGDA
jgi:predicted outer membrane lipoprotein